MRSPSERIHHSSDPPKLVELTAEYPQRKTARRTSAARDVSTARRGGRPSIGVDATAACAPRDRRVQSPRLTGGQLARRLGLFDATLIVMGGIVGSGIFMNPSVVARQVGTPALILGAWAIGGAIALTGAFIYAELAALRPAVGGQYA